MVPRMGIWRPAALHRDAATDYPPNAIVLLSPIALLPTAWVVPVWTLFSLALAPLLPYLGAALRNVRHPPCDRDPDPAVSCWTSARTLLQFSVLSMTLAALSLSWPTRIRRQRRVAGAGAREAAHRDPLRSDDRDGAFASCSFPLLSSPSVGASTTPESGRVH